MGEILRKGRLIPSILLAATLGLGVPVIAATAAQATNMVNCGTRTDFLKVTQFNGISQCFAYAGQVIIPTQQRQNISSISSGNNAITVTYYAGGCCDSSFYLGKWSSWYNPNPTAIYVKWIDVH